MAAPDPAGPAFPDAARSFRDPRLEPLPVPGLLVASENDPYCTLPRAHSLARGWNVPMVDAGALAHINDESGVGAWPQGGTCPRVPAGLGGAVLSG